MVSLIGNLRYRGNTWGSLPASDLSDVTYGQVERIQQEEQYRHEMMRQRQELHRRQMDLYQRLQVPQYLSQDSRVVSTWCQPGKSDSAWQKPSGPTFGVAPVVRNPSTSSNKDISSPLTVDCSVEYELPDFLKVSSGSGPPLLMKASQNQRSASSSVPENTTINESAKEPPTPNYWTNTKDSSAMLTQGSGGRRREPEQKHSSKPLQLQQQQQQPIKLQRKRKHLNADIQDGGGTKRQKMMALTPPDLISASHTLSSSSRWAMAANLSSSSRWANLSSSSSWAGLMQQPPVSMTQQYATSSMFPTTRTVFPDPTSLFPRPDPMLYPSSSGGLFSNPLSLHTSRESRFSGQMFSASGRMFPAGYGPMYSQYTQNPGCPSCITGICQRIYSSAKTAQCFQ